MNIHPEPSTAEAEGGALQIRSVEAIAIKVPLRKPMVMASQRIELAENLVVRVEAANGLVGWGEATVAPTMTGETLPGMVACVNEHLRPILEAGDAMERARLGLACRRAVEHNTGAKAAVEIALLDLVGRHLGVPAVELVGGRMRRGAMPMWLLGNPDIAADIREAHDSIAAGYRFLKLKVGVKPVEEEITAAHEIRRAVGPDVRLCADANTGWSLSEAQHYCQGTAEARLEFLEQPLPNRELAAMGTLNRQNLLPICGDECVSDAAEILQLGQDRIIAGANLKIIKAGGIVPLLEAATLCARLGMSVTLAGKVAGTNISAAATMVAACAAPTADWGINLTHVYLSEDVVREPLRVVDGAALLPDGPGLGIEVDEDAVRRFACP